jgi:Ni,Fe-hydrogenase III small subunit
MRSRQKAYPDISFLSILTPVYDTFRLGISALSSHRKGHSVKKSKGI